MIAFACVQCKHCNQTGVHTERRYDRRCAIECSNILVDVCDIQLLPLDVMQNAGMVGILERIAYIKAQLNFF